MQEAVNEQHIYPIGRFEMPQEYSRSALEDAVREIKVMPRILEHCIENLDEEQLHMPYREGGWTIAQIVHHLADSHMHAFMRCKWAFTEQVPVIKPYDERAWAETTDVALVPLNYSVTLLHALHHRWAVFLAALTEEELMRTFMHPETGKAVALWQMAVQYAWHGRHHAMQIQAFRARMNWRY